MRSRTSCRFSRRVAVVSVAAALLAGAAPAAQAADRYVAPGGSGTECTQAKPCGVTTGINSATNGDLVHVAGGLYPLLATALTPGPGVTVRGEGAERPEIFFASPGTFFVGEGASVSGLDLSRDSGTNIVLYIGGTGTASQMSVESPTGGLPIEMRGLLRDSFVEGTGNGVPAVQMAGTSGRLHNVTARATGTNGSAVRVYSSPEIMPIPCSLGEATLRNVIARAQYDLVGTGVTGCPVKIDVGHSNYRPGAVLISGPGGVVDAGGNQTTVDPLLDSDGLHQLAGSPTIDAGVALAQNGPFDFDGQPRLLGDAPDIGADEFPSPPKTPVVDGTGPVGSALKLKPRHFRPAKTRKPPQGAASASAKRRKGAPRTSRVTYSLSEDATVTFTVKRRVVGKRKGKRCVTDSAARKLKGKRCRKLVAVGRAFRHEGQAGANAFKFSGWVEGLRRIPERELRLRALSPGAYRLIAVPADAAGNFGAKFGAPFTIAR